MVCNFSVAMVINGCQEVYGDARLSSAQPAFHNKIIC